MSLRDCLIRVLRMPRLRRALRVLDLLATALTVISLGTGLYLAYLIGVWELVRLILVLLIPFILVSVLRVLIDAPRPAELFEVEFAPARRGRSFPSRHVHSAFSIGVALLFVCIPLGLSVLALGVCLGACRVFLGFHFPRDVIAGALTGTASALIGMLIL